MVQDLLDGLTGMLSFQPLFAILLGVLYGTLVGAIPGLSVSMGTALVLPFTYYLPPNIGIPFLLGIYKGGVYGGSIPAILISIPGAGGSIATMLDGYPLTLQGRSKTAIQLALYSSFIGDALSDLFTIFVAAKVASLAMLVGRIDFFAILLFSMVIISVATSKTVAKGLIAASLGLLLSMVGTDVGGRFRFAFGKVEIASGISFIPLIIGLFAFAVIIETIIKAASTKDEESKRLKRRIEFAKKDRLQWFEFRRCIPHILRSTVLGTFIGIIPGIGQSISAFLGYSVAKKFSREPEKFGKGSLEGLSAAESANNAVNGASLIPLFAFGIPGDTGTAILIGAFMAQGIRPGPNMFTENRVLMYEILVGMFIACFIMLIVGYLLSGAFAKVSYIPKRILVPIIFAVALVGTYAVNNNMFDVLLMVNFGFLGYLMKQYDFPIAPLAITFMLGHKIEFSLTQSLILVRGNILNFATRPLATAFFALTALILIGPSLKLLYNSIKKKKDRVPIKYV